MKGTVDDPLEYGDKQFCRLVLNGHGSSKNIWRVSDQANPIPQEQTTLQPSLK